MRAWVASLVVAVAVMTASPVPAQVLPPDDVQARLAAWLPGDFDNNQQVADARDAGSLTPHPRLHVTVRRITAPEIGRDVFALVAYGDNDPARVARRHLVVVDPLAEPAVRRLWMLWLPDRVGLQGPDAIANELGGLARSDLDRLPRCELQVTPDDDGVLATFPTDGCRLVVPGTETAVVVSGDLRVTSSEIWLNDRGRDEDGSLAWGRADHVPFRLQRARFFECWSVLRKEGTEDQYDVARNLLVHDQGQVVALGAPGSPPSRFSFDLARLKSAQSRTTVLRLAILEQGRAQSVAYAWAPQDAARIGINLRWAQVGCTLKEGTAPPSSAPTAGVAAAPQRSDASRPAFLFVQGRLKAGADAVYARYLEGTRPLLAKYGGEVQAVGEGLPSSHTGESWPINAVLRFPNRASAEAFLADPDYLAIKRAYRDAAYEVLHLSMFEGRPPRVDAAKGAPTVTDSTSLASEAAHHFRAVVERRIEDIVDRYWPGEDTYVFVEGPRWSTRGHDRIAAGWRAFVDAPLAVRSVDWVEGPVSQVAGELGWVGGIVELAVEAGGVTKRVRFRGTFVMRLGEDGAWRIVHEHFSQPAADPYGIGDWLPAKKP